MHCMDYTEVITGMAPGDPRTAVKDRKKRRNRIVTIHHEAKDALYQDQCLNTNISCVCPSAI